MDLSNDAIIVRDKNERITYWNKGATKIYGYTRQEAVGKVVQQLLKTELPEPLAKIYKKLLRDNQWQGEIVHTLRDGRRLTMFSRWALDRDAQGNRAYVLETNNDIYTCTHACTHACFFLMHSSYILFFFVCQGIAFLTLTYKGRCDKTSFLKGNR